MPTIKSKKYPDSQDHIQFVDADTWNEMKQKGLSRRFIIIDDGDIADTVVGTPEQIIDFKDTASVGVADETVEKVLSRDEIKAELARLEIEHNVRLGTEKLLQLLNDNK